MMIRMAKLKPRPRKIMEKDGSRGLVPVGRDSWRDTQYGSYLESLDLEHNDALKTALASSSDIRFTEFLRWFMMPSAKRRPVQALAKDAGIDLKEFMDWVGKAQNARTLALAQAASPSITEHMALDAASRMICCERCDGLGFVNAEEGLPMDTPGYRILRFISRKSADSDGKEIVEEIPVYIRDCPMGCERGRTRKAGDEFSREKVLEIAGHVNKKGPGLQITQHFGGQSMPSAVGRLDVMTIDVGQDPLAN